MAFRSKTGLESKFSAMRSGFADRGSRRFRQAFKHRLAYARGAGALPASTFDRHTGMKAHASGLKMVVPSFLPVRTVGP